MEVSLDLLSTISNPPLLTPPKQKTPKRCDKPKSSRIRVCNKARVKTMADRCLKHKRGRS